MSIDYRHYAFIRRFPSELIIPALFEGFLLEKPKCHSQRPSWHRIDTTVPEHTNPQPIIDILSKLDYKAEIDIMVQDWRWEDRNYTRALLVHGKTQLFEFKLLSSHLTDSQLTNITLNRMQQACPACGYNATPLLWAKDLHFSHTACPVCGTQVLFSCRTTLGVHAR